MMDTDNAPLTVEECLRDLRAWMDHAINFGPNKTQGTSDQSGHPHTWNALLVPDWQMKQKLANVTDTLESLAKSSGVNAAPLPSVAALDATTQAIVAAAAALLNRIETITTAEFERGGDKAEREALRVALGAKCVSA